MPAPLYFIEGCDVGSQSLYESLGLGYALAPSASYRAASTGPGGEAGIVVSRSIDGMGFYPDQQEWRDFGHCGAQDGSAVATGRRRMWFGWFRESSPAAADLVAGHSLPGHQVKLFDDREWLVPVAVQYAEEGFSGAIPASLAMGPNGEWTPGPIKPRYQQFWETASRFFEAYTGAKADESGVTFRVDNLSELACQVLSVNYRVTRREVAALGLLDTRGDTALEIMLAAIDWPTFKAWKSKKKAGEQSAE
jgi:hypothetical protein